MLLLYLFKIKSEDRFLDSLILQNGELYVSHTLLMNDVGNQKFIHLVL